MRGPSPYASWDYWKTRWMNNSLCFRVKTFQLQLLTSRKFVPNWVLGGDYGFVPALDFCLVNSIYNAWSSYIMLDPLLLANVNNHTDPTRTKGLYISFKLSRYSVQTSTVFNCVVPNMVRYTSVPNSHKFKFSPEEIRGQQPKGW